MVDDVTLRDIALHDCVYLNKPVKLTELTRAIEKLLAKPPTRSSFARFAPLTHYALRANQGSSSSMMTTKFAKRYAPCSKTMAAPSTPTQAARRFLTRFIPTNPNAC